MISKLFLAEIVEKKNIWRRCRWCNEVMEVRDTCMVCNECGAEDHPRIESKKQFNRAVKKMARIEGGVQLIKPKPKKTGGSRSKGASRKHLLKKPTVQRLYNRLFTET